jgi:DNA invertase Pin-like site-specific DNA recombinase
MTKALDVTTPSGRAMAGLLGEFAEFERESVKAGIAQARQQGTPRGRARAASLQAALVRRLRAERLSQSVIARRLGIGRTPVQRIFAEPVSVRSPIGRLRQISI